MPEGELSHLALNSRSGSYLALCADCRITLEEELLLWLSARVGVGRLLSDLLELPNKELVSHTDLRKVLIDQDGAEMKSGPMTTEQQLRAVELRNGPDVRDWVENGG
ncbi:hypothetical protein [Streptomyces atratus]|uniref:hypothetical protein n=1 Tax=Streptomyces atratus TaxID=1893 RepID=UPI00364B423C